jgi:hypothetical protein
MLKFKLDSLDGLDEAAKAFYAKNSDGKFVLQVDDDPAKSTIQKLREELGQTQKALKEREALEADAASVAAKAKAEAEKDYETAKKLSAAETEKLKKQLDEVTGRSHAYLKKSEATAAIAAAKGVPALLLPHLMDKLEVIPDGDTFKVVGKGGVALQDLVDGLKTDSTFARAFEAQGGSGAGTPPGGPKGGGHHSSPQTIARDDSRGFLANLDKVAKGEVSVK